MLKEIIRKEIEREGFITFDRFVELCLYHPEFGYYTAKRTKALPGEDFFTAPELSPVFGRTVAHHIKRVAEKKGIPLNVLELGGGKGFLAKDLIESLPIENYFLLEKTGVAEKVAPKVKVIGSLKEIDGFCGFVLSNEFFDAFPFKRVVKKDGKLWEVVLKLREEELSEDLVPYSGGLPCEPREGCEYSFFTGWEEFLSELFQRFKYGYFLAFDYGSSCQELKGRGEGTFRAFKGHALVDDYLKFVGEVDLTSSVDFDYLQELLRGYLNDLSLEPLSVFLLSNGVERFLTPEEVPVALQLLVDMGRKFRVVSGFKHACLL